MKAVLMSIQPKWCELIASGKKTVEVRKTKPKLDVPFKVYIYCTKASKKHQTVSGSMVINDDELYRLPTGEVKHGCSLELWGGYSGQYDKNAFLNGKVIGEFVCNNIETIDLIYSENLKQANSKINEILENSRLSAYELLVYLSRDKTDKNGYAWYISDLVIYDTPKELGEFFKACDKPKGIDCSVCVDNGENVCRSLKKPPQSWCYVEEQG